MLQEGYCGEFGMAAEARGYCCCPKLFQQLPSEVGLCEEPTGVGRNSQQQPQNLGDNQQRGDLVPFVRGKLL
jgi:hypothetical protein